MKESESKPSDFPEIELLNSMEELQEVIKEVMQNGTVEQKLNLLLGDYYQRIERDKFQVSQQMQMNHLRSFGFCEVKI